jgi:hypothetical protein
MLKTVNMCTLKWAGSQLPQKLAASTIQALYELQNLCILRDVGYNNICSYITLLFP